MKMKKKKPKKRVSRMCKVKVVRHVEEEPVKVKVVKHEYNDPQQPQQKENLCFETLNEFKNLDQQVHPVDNEEYQTPQFDKQAKEEF
jgi:hypothetical protein